MDLQQSTIQLKEAIDTLHDRYLAHSEPADRTDHEFFEKVKRETTPHFTLAQEWFEQAEVFVKSREVSVHPNQIQSTHENIEMLILHSYYLDVDKNRYKNLYNSSHYVLDMVLDNL
ncbi:DUF1798 family protein [Salimicrobium halophilum]|uniref:DUF1798 family protein n=1 Tax=Salimicrobium halophilum TaxID=86666 RepID=A0A1G8Q287_9BACI|nr:DUF1798 family protein [Salimicrobium halophilum]SDI98869.1 protein of unknown function [Salimicrobium halophilum]